MFCVFCFASIPGLRVPSVALRHLLFLNMHFRSPPQSSKPSAFKEPSDQFFDVCNRDSTGCVRTILAPYLLFWYAWTSIAQEKQYETWRNGWKQDFRACNYEIRKYGDSFLRRYFTAHALGSSVPTAYPSAWWWPSSRGWHTDWCPQTAPQYNSQPPLEVQQGRQSGYESLEHTPEQCSWRAAGKAAFWSAALSTSGSAWSPSRPQCLPCTSSSFSPGGAPLVDEH